MAESLAEREVSKYHKAKETLNEFLTDPDIRDILQEYHQLVDEYNQSLDTAMRSIKSALKKTDQDKLIIEGLGAQKKYKRYHDAEFLASALPADQTDEFMTEKVVYEIDKARLDQLVRQGEIDSDIVAQAYHEDEQNPANMNGTPKPFSLPSLPEL